MLQATEQFVVTLDNLKSASGAAVPSAQLTTIFKTIADALAAFPGATILTATLILEAPLASPPPPPSGWLRD